jgi:hypothetical protein
MAHLYRNLKEWIETSLRPSNKYRLSNCELRQDAQRALLTDVPPDQFTSTMIVCGFYPCDTEGQFTYFSVEPTEKFFD